MRELAHRPCRQHEQLSARAALSAKLKEPNTKETKFEDVVKGAEKAAVLVLVY